MKNNFGTINETAVTHCAKEHRLSLLLLFGSRASGEAHAMSDFDFGYISDKVLSYAEETTLRDDLGRIAGSRDIETIDLLQAGPFLLREVIRNHKILFTENDSYERFYVGAVRAYLDESKLFDLEKSLYQQTLEKYRKQYAQ